MSFVLRPATLYHLIFLILFFLPLQAPASWTVEAVDTSGTAGKYTSITLDWKGQPHISYSDSGQNPNTLLYASHASGSWVTETVEGSTSAGFTSISLDSLDHAHISYGGLGYKYATNASGEWVTEVMEGSGAFVTSTSLKNDPGDKVHIGYVFAPTSGVISLKYTNNTTGSWVPETVDSDLDFGPSSSSIALDSAGGVHIGYSDSNSVRYATNASGSWVTETLDSGQYASLAVDPAGVMHIAYYDTANSDLKYATNVTGSWAVEVIDSVGDVGQHTSIAADAGGNVHVAYYDVTGKDLKYAGNSAGSWTIEIPDSDGDVGQYASLAVDRTCALHVSYYDQTDSSLTYASRASYTTFPDIPPGYWAEDYISALSCAKITSGYEDGTYRPEDRVTRGQMAVFIVRGIEGDDAAACTSAPFTDVTSGHIFCKYIKRAKDLSIVSGFPDGTYRPTQDVKRGEMAAFIIKGMIADGQLAGEPADCLSDPFTDVPSGHIFCKYIQELVHQGIASGFPDGTYRPSQKVTRAQMAVFIGRAFLSMP